MSRRFVVAGAPCAGKSSYVRERMRRGEVVVDYDTLHQALSGLGSHEHDKGVRPYVLAARDCVLEELAANEAAGAWVVTSSPKAAELRRLRELLGAEVVLLRVDREEAHRRCDEDGRPAQWHGFIDNWFEGNDIDPSEFEEKSAGGGQAMERKTYRGRMEFKAGEKGEFVARFATLGVVDHDGDVTEPGAFETGQGALIEAWNHNYGELPVGKAVIREEDEDGSRVALAEGTFFLDTMGGLEHYKTVKNLGDLQEWSYTFFIVDSGPGKVDGRDVRLLKKLDVVGVGPVDRGAGIGTGTVMIKTRPAGALADGAIERISAAVGAAVAAEMGRDDGASGGGESGAEGAGGKSGKGETETPSGPARSRLLARVMFGWLGR